MKAPKDKGWKWLFKKLRKIQKDYKIQCLTLDGKENGDVSITINFMQRKK